MKFLALFILSTAIAAPVNTNNKTSGVVPILTQYRISENADGHHLVLKFDPVAPKYTSFYAFKSNGTEISWTGSAKQFTHKTFEFNNPEVPFTKVIVWSDPQKNKGILQLHHRNDNQYSFSNRGTDELILFLKAKKKLIPPPTRNVAEVKPAPKTKRVSINVKDVPLTKLLRTLASETNRSVVFGDEVTGSMTVNIKDQTYEEAVNTVLKPTKYRAEHSPDATIIRSAKDGKVFRVFKLQHTDVSSVYKTIQDMVKEGTTSMEVHSNSIFVNDSVENIAAIERIVATMDIPIKQVEVETAVIELQDTNSNQVGFNLTSAGLRSLDSENSIIGNVSTKNISPFDPASASAKGMFVGLSWKSVSGILGFLNTNSKMTILARPRVVALNEHEANIVIGSKIGYKTIIKSADGNVEDVKFLVVGTQLKIKPHITPSEDILMSIRPEISDGQLDSVTLLPSETTTYSDSRVLAKDGQTIVIGGLLRDRTEKTEAKVPFLGDIPIIGWFFKGKTETIAKTEIMILLSPRILKSESASLHEKEAELMVDRVYNRRDNTFPPPKRLNQEP